MSALQLIEARVAEQSVETKLALRTDFPKTGRSATRDDLTKFAEDIEPDFGRVGSVDCAVFGLAQEEDAGAVEGNDSNDVASENKSPLRVRVAVEFAVGDEDLLFECPATMAVRGTDLVVVDGIFDQIREKLDTANQAPLRFPVIDGFLAAFIALVSVGGAAFLAAATSPDPKSSTIELSTAGYVSIGALVLILILIPFYRWMTVLTEFLGDGERTRWHRSKKVVIGAIGAFAISIVAGVALFPF